jgi:hypothetical protein
MLTNPPNEILRKSFFIFAEFYCIANCAGTGTPEEGFYLLYKTGLILSQLLSSTSGKVLPMEG